MIRPPPTSTLFPYTTLFRSGLDGVIYLDVPRNELIARVITRGKREGRSDDTARDERSEEHTSELQSRGHLVCRLLLEKKKKIVENNIILDIEYSNITLL